MGGWQDGGKRPFPRPSLILGALRPVHVPGVSSGNRGKGGKGDAHPRLDKVLVDCKYLISPHEVVSGSLTAEPGPSTHHLEAALCGVGVGSSMQGRTLPVREATFWGPLGGDKSLCCTLWGKTVLRLHLTVVQTFHGLLGLWCFGGGRLFKGLRFCHFSCVFSPLFSGPFMFYSV